MEDGSFPKSVKLGGPPKDPSIFDSRAVAWIEDEVEQWIESRIEERNLGSTDVPPGQNFER
jgi:predicted DNA-binding transcriptional regulator AlpA|tara:strand:+ start:326 stop:508 length:183 start_codon:yes stop_codon:yes gene_type:complete